MKDNHIMQNPFRPFRAVLPFLLIAVIEPCGFAQSNSVWESVLVGPYAVGYEKRDLFDYSRTFKPENDYFGNPTIGEIARPIPLHLFFPAGRNAEAVSVSYADFIAAAAISSVSETGKDSLQSYALVNYKTSLGEMGVSDAVADRLLSAKTPVYLNTQPVPGKYPVIIYVPSINSDPYENLVLISCLVSHGYLVISCPSVGAHTIEVTRDVMGAEAVARDIEFLLSYIRQLPQADRDHVGCLGFSWGGMISVAAAMRNYTVDAVVCLDGAQFFPKYKTVAAQLVEFDAHAFRVPFLGFVRNSADRDYGFFDDLKFADACLIKLAGIPHRAFGSDYIMWNDCIPDNPAEDVQRMATAYRVICSYTLNFFNALLRSDTAGQTYIQKEPLRNGFISNDIQHQWKPARCHPPREKEFLQIINERGVAEAVRIFADVRSKDSTAVFFREEDLLQYTIEWGPERADELLRLLLMNIQAYPQSADSYFWLGQVSLAKNDLENARKSLRQALTINPEHEKAKKLLTKIGE
ncbi:hypothetical protein EHM69_12605 [candidate division KSB1 bacterium]|nr:MAG: hypothetical protein EHM69_12605 [candidate division KSB1 bacterium]